MGNIMTGVDAQRDEALRSAGRGGHREILRALNLCVAQERRVFPLADYVPHPDIRKGTLCGLDESGHVVPLHLKASLRFEGIAEAVGYNRGHYKVALLVRAAITLRVRELSKSTPLHTRVYLASSSPEVFTLTETDTFIGILVGKEGGEGGLGIVAFKPIDDDRFFEIGGPRPAALAEVR